MRVKSVVIFVVVLLLAAMPLTVMAQGDDEREARLAVLERFGEEIWEAGRFEVAEEILTEDFLVHFWGGLEADRETYIEETVKPTRAAFPDWSTSNNFALVDGDYLVIDDNWGGTFTNEAFGLPPTGKEVRVNGLEIFRFEGEKIAEAWILFDRLSYLQQIGAVSVEGEALPDEPWDIALGESDTPAEEIKAEVVGLFEDVANHDMVTYFAKFAEDSVVHDLHDDLTRDEAKDYMIMVQSAWPDHHTEDAMFFAEGDLVVSLYTMIFAEDEVEFGGVNVNRYADGMFVEEWWLYDAYDVMLQTTPSEE